MKESLEHVLHLIMFMLLIDVSVCVYCLKVHDKKGQRQYNNPIYFYQRIFLVKLYFYQSSKLFLDSSSCIESTPTQLDFFFSI